MKLADLIEIPEIPRKFPSLAMFRLIYSLAHPIVHGDFSAKLSGVAPGWLAGSVAIYSLGRFLRLLASPKAKHEEISRTIGWATL